MPSKSSGTRRRKRANDERAIGSKPLSPCKRGQQRASEHPPSKPPANDPKTETRTVRPNGTLYVYPEYLGPELHLDATKLYPDFTPEIRVEEYREEDGQTGRRWRRSLLSI